MKKFNFGKVFGYGLLTIIFILMNYLAINSLIISQNAIKNTKTSIANHNDTFEKNSFYFNPYSLSYNGYADTKSFLNGLSQELGADYLGYIERNAWVNVSNGVPPVNFVDNFVFENLDFKLIKGKMPDVSKTTATYVEALGLAQNEETLNHLEIDKEVNWTFSKNNAEKKVKIKIVGYAEYLNDHLIKYNFNESTLLVPDISQLINLEIRPSGINMTLVFKNEAAQKVGIDKAKSFGVVTDSGEAFVKSQELRLIAYKAENKSIILFMIISILVTLSLLLLVTYYLFKNNRLKSKLDAMLFPFASAVLFLILDFLFYIRNANMFAILIACICVIATTLTGISCGIYRKIKIITTVK